MSFTRVLYPGLLFLALSSVPANAGSLSIGFEAPVYTVGNINGQNGWSNTGGYDAVVSNGAGVNGSGQSLRISNGVASGSFGDQTFTPHLGVAAGEFPGAGNLFQASWSFMPVTGELQDGLFISVSPDNGAGGRMSYVGLGEDTANGLYVGFYDWSLSRYNAGLDPWVYQLLANNLDRTAWHRVDMTITFNGGPSNDVVTVALDGTAVGSGGTWEDFQRYGPTGDGGGGGLSPVNSLLFRAGGSSVPSNLGKGFYVDDVTLSSQATPEPGTIGLILAGLGGVVAFGRRRR